jgi:hypothetical protein
MSPITDDADSMLAAGGGRQCWRTPDSSPNYASGGDRLGKAVSRISARSNAA